MRWLSLAQADLWQVINVFMKNITCWSGHQCDVYHRCRGLSEWAISGRVRGRVDTTWGSEYILSETYNYTNATRKKGQSLACHVDSFRSSDHTDYRDNCMWQQAAITETTTHEKKNCHSVLTAPLWAGQVGEIWELTAWKWLLGRAGLTLKDIEPVLQPGFRHWGQQSLGDTRRTSPWK